MPALPPPPATDRLRFSGEVPVPTRLAACKEFLKVETAALRARHEAGATGLATTHRARRGPSSRTSLSEESPFP